MTEVGKQFLVPALAVLGESCQEGGVEQLVLWAGSALGLQHGSGDGLDDGSQDGGSKQFRGVVELIQPGQAQKLLSCP